MSRGAIPPPLTTSVTSSLPSMPRLLLLLLAFTSLLAPASAQQRVAPPTKEYLDSLFTVLPSAVGAQYYRETVRTDSLAGEVKDYYLSGKLQSSGTFDDVQQLVPNGRAQWHARNLA
jgi:hypothetical protein